VRRARVSSGSRAARAALLALPLLLGPFARPVLAQPGELATVAVDRLRVGGGGRHEAWVSALDSDGRPVGGLEPGAFSVTLDRRPIPKVDVSPFARRYSGLGLTVLVDADLLRDPGLGAMREMIQALARGGGPHDVLRVVGLAARSRSLEIPAPRAAELSDRLAGLAEPEPGPRLYDALFDAVRAASRAGDSEGGAVLLVTRGGESGSRRGVPDVLAVSTARARAVPVIVLLLDEGSGSAESERLSKLAARTGGGFMRLDSPGRFAGAAGKLVARLRGAYQVAFSDPRWNAGEEKHSLQVTIERSGIRRWGVREYETADVVGAPWWQGPLPWVVLAVIAIVAGGVSLALFRRRLCRLVVQDGEERGCSYEIFALPATLGAAVGNDLTFPEVRISRNHAVLERRGSGIDLVDLNSENGTFVNGDRVSRRRLAHGDRISVGGAVELVYEGRS
jgi:hypothetical protein